MANSYFFFVFLYKFDDFFKKRAGVGFKQHSGARSSAPFFYDLRIHITQSSRAGKNPLWFFIFKSDCKFVERADPARYGNDRVGRTGKKQIPAGIIKSGINNKIVKIYRKVICFYVREF